MQEAKEAAKLKIKQIELQKKEALRAKSTSSSPSYPGLTRDEPLRTVPTETIPLSRPNQASRLGKGMKLTRRADEDFSLN
jgi:hypothetical protein